MGLFFFIVTLTDKMNKKGQVDFKNIGSILIGCVLVVTIIIAFTSLFLSGLNEFSEEDACSDASCSFGNPSGFCAINSSSEGSGISCPNDVRESLPLGTLFTVVLGVVFAVAMFLFIRKSIMKG